jgi:hypothetical protein
MAKLLPTVTNPLSGNKINFSIAGLLGLIIGTAVLLWVVDLGTTLKNRAKMMVPGNIPFIGYNAPTPAQSGNSGANYGI